jgi:hypothetical protein
VVTTSITRLGFCATVVKLRWNLFVLDDFGGGLFYERPMSPTGA